MPLITIATYDFPAEAHIAKTLLQSHGIEAFVFDDHLVSVNFLMSNAIGGVKLKVLDEDEAKALETLGASVDYIDSGEGEPIDTCPKCNSDDVWRKPPYFWEVFGTFWLFGAPLRLQSKRRKCRLCKEKWHK